MATSFYRDTRPHVRERFNQEYTCPVCDATQRTEGWLRWHLSHVHPGYDPSASPPHAGVRYVAAAADYARRLQSTLKRLESSGCHTASSLQQYRQMMEDTYDSQGRTGLV